MTPPSTPDPPHVPRRLRKEPGGAKPTPDLDTLLRLRDQLVQFQDHVDDMLDDIHRPSETPAPGGLGASRRRPARRRTHPHDGAWNEPMGFAARSVEKVSVVTPEHGRARVEIDGVSFTLPRGVGVLLDVLAAPGAVNGDGSAGWKTVPEILDRLEQRLGRKFGVHALDELVRRLRRHLMAAGFSRHVLEVDPVRGKRIAVRHAEGGGPPPI